MERANLGQRRYGIVALLTLSVLVSPLAAASGLPAAVPSIRGTYVLFMGEGRVGTESFRIEPTSDGARLEARTKIDVIGVKVDQAVQLHVNAQLEPVTFSFSGSTGEKKVESRVTFARGKATAVSDAGVVTTTPYDGKLVVLPGSNFSGYNILIARYDKATGGDQPFKAYPDVPISVRLVRQDPVTVRGKREVFDLYRVAVSGQNTAVWVNREGVVAAVSSQALGLDAVLQQYVPARDALVLSLLSLSGASSAPSAPAVARAEDVRIPAPGLRLAGTLILPAGVDSPPCVLLVPGSEARDRDGTVYGVPIYAQIAARLAKDGFAVLRYDERGVGASGGNASSLSLPVLVEDAKAALRYLRGRREVNGLRAGLVGFGDGAVVAAMVASMDPTIDALALLDCPGGTVGTALEEDLQRRIGADTSLDAASRERALKAVQQAISPAGKTEEEGLPAAIRQEITQPWRKALLEASPKEYLKLTAARVLILHGGLDRQVDPRNAALLEQAAKAANRGAPKVVVLRNLNHLLVAAHTGEVAEYASLSTTVDERALSTLSTWMKEATAKPPAG